MDELMHARVRVEIAEERLAAQPEDGECRLECERAWDALEEIESRHAGDPFWFMQDMRLALT